MKAIAFLAVLLFTSFGSIAQKVPFRVGDTWPYENSFVRDSAYQRYPNHPAQLHDFLYYEGRAKVTYNNKVGFIDSNKTIVIPLMYANELGANKFIHSKSVVVKNNKWGVIDKSGATFFPFRYDKIKRFGELYCVFTYFDKWGYLDAKGNTILPIRDYNCSYIMTEDEIFELAKKYEKRDRLENSVPISKRRATAIAKRTKHFYNGNEMPYKPVIELNISRQEWSIETSEYGGGTRKGKCAKTNGCTIIRKAKVIVDSETGKVKNKSKWELTIPNYE